MAVLAFDFEAEDRAERERVRRLEVLELESRFFLRQFRGIDRDNPCEVLALLEVHAESVEFELGRLDSLPRGLSL